VSLGTVSATWLELARACFEPALEDIRPSLLNRMCTINRLARGSIQLILSRRLRDRLVVELVYVLRDVIQTVFDDPEAIKAPLAKKFLGYLSKVVKDRGKAESSDLSTVWMSTDAYRPSHSLSIPRLLFSRCCFEADSDTHLHCGKGLLRFLR
jgi:hypothetical protein